MKLLLLPLLAITILLGLSFEQSFAEDKYGSPVNEKKIGLTEEGKKHLDELAGYTPRSTGVIFKVCLGSTWSTFGWDEPTYGNWDQQELKQHLVSKCVEPDANFSLWPTGKVYLLAIAPSSNLDEHKVDRIGGPNDPIICTSRDAGRVQTGASDSGFMTEIGHDTGVFAGSVSLGGPSYKRLVSESGMYQFGGTNDGDAESSFGSIKTCGLKASSNGAFTVTWEYNDNEYVSKTIKYSYREADVQFGKDIYYPGDKAKVIVHDRDLLRWSWDSKLTPVHVWSDTDKAGVNVGVNYDRQFWIPSAADGRNSGTVELSTTRDSQYANEKGGASAVLKVSPGDNIYMAYRDYTMPPPFSSDNCRVEINFQPQGGFGRFGPIGPWVDKGTPEQALSECAYKRVVNTAKVSDKSPDSKLTLATTPDKHLPKISFIEYTDSVKIPDDALKKYSASGKYLVKTWWEHDRKFLLGADNKINVVVFDGLTEKQIPNVQYHFTFTEDDKTIVGDRIFSVDGHEIHKVKPSKIGNSEFTIGLINGDSNEEVKFTITATDEIFEIFSVYYDAGAMASASSTDMIEYLEQKESVPKWIEFSVNKWMSGEISDVELVNQISYLIKEQII